jgi:hypothetical protein
MSEKPGPFTGLDDTTLGERQPGLGSLGDDESILDRAFEDVEPGGPPPMPQTVAPPELQASTQATQECMRGPCEHHWRMLMRMDAQAEIITIQRVQYCTRHVELVNLHNENAYECDCWWPIPLLLIPASLRPMLRPLIRELWDLWLKVAKGESFDWRWWPRNVFDLDPDTVEDLRAAARRRRAALEDSGTNGGGEQRFDVDEEELEQEFDGLGEADVDEEELEAAMEPAGLLEEFEALDEEEEEEEPEEELEEEEEPEEAAVEDEEAGPFDGIDDTNNGGE